MSHGSLFTGIGLLDFGLMLGGLDAPAWVCERDDWRRDEVLARRFPDAVRHADVRDVGSATATPVDILAGGFPCKGARSAGLRNGFDHPETVLWREFFRAIGELGPAIVVVENVRNILSLKGGAVWGEVLGDLASLGFDVEWDCLPAAAVGAPHRRDRVFAVAAHPDRLPMAAGRWRRQAAGADHGAPADPAGVAERAAHHEADALAARGEAREVPRLRGAGAPANADGRGQPQQSERHREWWAGLDGTLGHDAQRRGVRVDWGRYGPAIARWEQALGRPAPEPLVRGVDDRRAAGVERSRLSALGDGVQVQVGRLVGAHIVGMLSRATAASTTPERPATAPTAQEERSA